MQYQLSNPHVHYQMLLYRIAEWGIAFLLMMGLSPVLKELLLYFLVKLYEYLIQYQYFS
ncbi:hypothetical protein [Chitinophaga defluvii]|uniref:Uncharacterized protein n=1 Tax=Chitinophaga defluvii TaxID=3163343 RepID=A0ABV2T169_9BACT